MIASLGIMALRRRLRAMTHSFSDVSYLRILKAKGYTIFPLLSQNLSYAAYTNLYFESVVVYIENKVFLINMSTWQKSKVKPGKQIGRIIGFPTINLYDLSVFNSQKRGVYACLVRDDSKIYKGLLYFGPRTIIKETKDTLEIYLIDYKGIWTEEEIEFLLLGFVREVIHFENSTFEELGKQQKNDLKEAEEIFKKHSS